jgi:hypothetical protein
MLSFEVFIIHEMTKVLKRTQMKLNLARFETFNMYLFSMEVYYVSNCVFMQDRL